MYLYLRERIADRLRKAGYRVLSPFKLPLGWVDMAILGKSRIGVDFYNGVYESCVERLTSYPFRDIYILGDCDGCIPLEDFCKEFGIKMCYEENNPEEQSIELENPSIQVKAIEDGLAYMYIAKEVYEKDIEYRPLKTSIGDLKMLGYVISSSKPKLKPEMFASLTHEGYTAAKKVIYRRIMRNRKKLEKLASNPKNYLIALGISESLAVKRKYDSVDVNFKSLLQFMKKFPLEDEIFRTEAHPKVQLCEFMVNSALNGDAVELAEELRKMGLAFRIKSYSPYGYEMGEEYRIAREAVEMLLKSGYSEIPGDITGEFLAVTYPMKHSDIYPILNHAGKYLMNAEKMGVCSINGTKIRIGEKFAEYARVRLAMLMEKIIEGLS